MRIQLIRNATIKITYGSEVLLIDPWLLDRGEMGCLVDPVTVALKTSEKKNPLTPLPLPVEEVLRDVSAYIVTHIHPDHFDMNPSGTGGDRLDKKLPIFVQDMKDETYMLRSGFRDVRCMLAKNNRFGAIEIIKTPALHGTKEPFGNASGIVLRTEGEKTVYIAGDTVFYDEVETVIRTYRPEVIVLNACAASMERYGRLIMNAEDVLRVCHLKPDAVVVAVHMDTVSHAGLTRRSLRMLLDREEAGRRVLIPEDGEILRM